MHDNYRAGLKKVKYISKSTDPPYGGSVLEPVIFQLENYGLFGFLGVEFKDGIKRAEADDACDQCDGTQHDQDDAQCASHNPCQEQCEQDKPQDDA